MGKKNKKGLGAIKTAAKTEKKATLKLKKELKSKGEEDIEQILAEIQELDRKNEQIVEESGPQPSPRSSFSFTAHPDKDELLLFGGEYFNGNKTFLYNDLYIYRLKKKEWVLLKAPGAPPPRCAHQAVALSQSGGQLWLFGGEFASPTQSQFHHYKDLWVFHLQDKRWEKITAPGGPSARSGHRMVAIKQQLIVFGGFHDNNRDYKYFNDIYAFNLETYTWLKLEVKGQAPSPRSGCQMLAISDGRVLIYGGYSKDRLKKDVDRGIVHSDMFILLPDKGDVTGTKWQWTQVKQSGLKPSPRSGCTMAALPNGTKAYMFGGVYDEESDETLEGSFFNDLYQLDIDNRKWHSVRLCGKKSDATEKARRRVAKLNRLEDLVGNKIEEDVSSDIPDGVSKMELGEGEIDTQQEASVASEDGIFTLKIGPQNQNLADSEACFEQESGIKPFVPRPRMNSGLIIKHGILFLYGGAYEAGDKNVTLADLYSLDLHKMDMWQTLVEYDDKDQEWLESESSEEDEVGEVQDEENDSEESTAESSNADTEDSCIKMTVS